jgi:hypothetical protein
VEPFILAALYQQTQNQLAIKTSPTERKKNRIKEKDQTRRKLTSLSHRIIIP